MIKELNMVPKVLVSDKLSQTAIKIFKEKGIEVDFMPEVGKDKDPLEAKKIFEKYEQVNVEMINDYNGDIRVLKVMKC